MSGYSVPGYVGICADCFCPIATGEGVTLREGGRHFHKQCVEDNPAGYYVKLEKRRADRLIRSQKQSLRSVPE